MRRLKRISLSFFILGFCTCILLTGIIRFVVGYDWKFGKSEQKEYVLSKVGECEDCSKIANKFWDIGKLKDGNESHLECARRMGIQPMATNAEFEERLKKSDFTKKLIKLEDSETYLLKNLTHSYPYLTKEASELLDEIGERFEKKLEETNIGHYRMLISSVLRTNESQNGLGKRNGNATKSLSAHLYGTTFDISYKEFIPINGTPAPEGYCRHDMLRHPLAEVLTEMSKEGRCKVVREVKQACYHITVAR